MNKLFYQILGITGIVLGGITVLDWVSSQDIYSLIGGGLWLVAGISIMKLLKEIK